MPRPRPKLPPGVAVDPRNGARVQLPATPRLECPDPPAGLCGSALAAWSNYWSDSVSHVVRPADIVLVERWVIALNEWVEAMTEFREERWETGSQGQRRLSPMATWIQSREAEMRHCEDRLGISPRARARLGIAIAEGEKSLADLNAALEAD